ncbi:hypothetical protein CKM354_001164400 [Cercospora kikuchii]|uniref:Uncharacterized protein n=1 Tax=Cercospora kikuchii TaxID=84275 RepID=A0A9P3CU15_9PEZI|nr:uncharacterized protein CKM354_001164400 [Cercospora kikuchii]GIZ48591.1 hypothetical protein CKM354_001164400 [Cercospora kikuchii]
MRVGIESLRSLLTLLLLLTVSCLGWFSGPRKKIGGVKGGGGISKPYRRTKKFDLDRQKKGAMEEMMGLDYDDADSVMEE